MNEFASNCIVAGLPTVWALARLVEVTRYYNWLAIPSDQVLKEVNEPKIIGVSKSQQITCYPSLYTLSGLNNPMDVSVSAEHMGRTSITFCTSFADEASGEPMAAITRQIVAIDAKNRKSVPLPQGVLDTFSGNPDAKPLKIEPTPCPSDAFKFDLQAVHSDTDNLYHVNQSVFIRYCMDAAAAAADQDALVGVTKDFLDYKVRDMRVLYQGELHPGNRLTVHVWQTPHPSSINLNFQITRDSKSMCFATAVLSE